MKPCKNSDTVLRSLRTRLRARHLGEAGVFGKRTFVSIQLTHTCSKWPKTSDSDSEEKETTVLREPDLAGQALRDSLTQKTGDPRVNTLLFEPCAHGHDLKPVRRFARVRVEIPEEGNFLHLGGG